MQEIEETLNERNARYGAFIDHAVITQRIKKALASGISWENMSDDKKQSMEMFADKMARIVNGDPEYDDSWVDIIGYAQLVVDNLQKKQDEETTNKDTTSDKCGLDKLLWDYGRVISFDMNDDGVDAMTYACKTIDMLRQSTEEEVYPRNEYNKDENIVVSVLNEKRDYIVLRDKQRQLFKPKKVGELGKNLPTMRWSKTKKGE